MSLTYAQEEVTATYLKNADFDSQPTFTDNSGETEAELSGRAYLIEGWTKESNDDWFRAATSNYGLEFESIPDALNSVNPPANDINGEAEGAVLMMSAAWGNTAQMSQSVSLPAGTYELSYDVLNQNAGRSIETNLFGFIPEEGTPVYGTTTTFSNTWTTETVKFTLNDATQGKISIGIKALGKGSGDNGKLAIDNIKLYFTAAKLSDLEAAIRTAQEATADGSAGESYMKTAIAQAQEIYEKGDKATASEILTAIDAVKKFIAEQDLNAAHRYVPDVVQPSLQGPWPQKIAIIGGGPAGLSCAYFLAVQGYKPTVFEKNERPGGMLRYGIPSFKLEKNVIDAEIDILRELGVDIRCGVEVGKDVTLAELRRQGYRAFYIAIGCQGGRRAGVPGEDAAGIETAVHLLRTVGGDESRKMTGKTVVIGGGNVAIDAARVSLRCGSDGVTMVCLEPRDKMPASPEEIAEAEEEGTKITCGYGPKEFLSENGHVAAVVLKKCTGLYNAEGRFAPTYDENDTITLPCDNVVLSIGQCIEWGDLLNGEAVQLGRGQGAVADALTYQTAQPDIFVGGDVCTGPRFAIDAIAAGKQGAISIHRFVQPNTSLTIGRNRRDFHELDKSNLALGEYDRAPRQSAALDAGIDAHRSFRDAHLTLTEDQVKIETARCLGCGASVVDPNKCIGCGVCTTKCEFDAIRLHRDLPECSKMVRSEDKFKAILPYMAKREIKIRFAKKEK